MRHPHHSPVITDQTANKICITTVNCRSLISDRKKVDLQDLIETHKPNIILGSESHLDSCIASCEIFPDTYATPYRKDRKLGEGGIFTAVDNNYITTEVVSNCNCEIVWTKINIQGSQPLYLGSYYRQPSSTIEIMEELEKSIEAITISNNGRLPNIILSGDFNLPSIDWETNTVRDNPQYGQAINSKLVEIANNNDLIQMVTEPTRGNNILDLLFTTNPALVEHIEIHPGMSDHNIVITDVNLRARTVMKKPRKVHLFKKADMGSLDKDIEQDLTRYLEDENIENETTEDLWQFFKETITKAVTKHVPQKTIGGKQHVPWINTHIKRLI